MNIENYHAIGNFEGQTYYRSINPEAMVLTLPRLTKLIRQPIDSLITLWQTARQSVSTSSQEIAPRWHVGPPALLQ
jgi:hypothetical protein